MKYQTKLYTLFLLFSVTTVLLAMDDIDGIRITLKANDLVVVQAGEKIYQTHCAACHGANLEGQPDWKTRDDNGFLPAPPHDATGHTWHHADDLLFEITKYGVNAVINDASYKSIMPVYKDILNDEEIIAVLSFIKHSWPEKERSWQEEVNGNQEGFMVSPKKKSTLLEKLTK